MKTLHTHRNVNLALFLILILTYLLISTAQDVMPLTLNITQLVSNNQAYRIANSTGTLQFGAKVDYADLNGDGYPDYIISE